MGAEGSKPSTHHPRPCRPSETFSKPNASVTNYSNNSGSNAGRPFSPPRIGHMIVANNSRSTPPCMPVNCAPRPIKSLPVEANLAWVAETEAALAVDWCTRRAASGKAGAANGTASATAEVPPATSEGKGVAHVTLCCPGAPFPANRSTGVVYPAITLPTQAAGSSSGSGAAALPAEIPVGEMYYEKLHMAWLQKASKPPAMPPRAEKDELDDSLILESIEGSISRYFRPAIPLNYMIDLLVPEWEEKGLYDEIKSP